MRSDITPVLEKYLPTFCWMTAHDVLTFLEQLDEDVQYDCVKVTLCYLSKGACPRVEKKLMPVRHALKRIGGRVGGIHEEYVYRFNPRFPRAPSSRRGTASHAAVIACVEQSTRALPTRPSRTPATAFSLSPVPVHTSPISSGATSLAT